MNIVDILKLGSAVVVSLGGSSLILLALSSWLGRVWAERILERQKAIYAVDLEEFKKKLVLETESHKIRLKKSELIFAREFDAASSLVALVKDITPTYKHPMMDWNDACDDIARDFGKIENLIAKYLRDNGAVLNDQVKDILASCEAIAAENQFEVISGEVSPEANKAADDMYAKLQKAEETLLVQVRGQVTI